MLSSSLKHSCRIQYITKRHLSTWKQCLDVIEKHNSKLNAFISVNDTFTDTSSGSLKGMPIAIKDNFCTTSLKTTCASSMLKEFTSPYDATVVKLLNESGAVLMGKTNMDEFGMGSANVHSVFGPVVNPYLYKNNHVLDEDKRTAGGSSGGSAAAVAMNMCTAALGSDTGGSVRMPASFCGIVGFKPSYGMISRHGLVAYANSLDTVGILSRSVDDCSKVYDVISQYDIKDPTSVPPKLRTQINQQDEELASKYEKDLSGLVVGIPQEYYVDSLSSDVLHVWKKGIQHLKDLGAKVISVSLPHVPLALPAYYIIAMAEASSNLARFDGVRFGHRKEDNPKESLYKETRTNGFGAEVQRRILLGTHVLTAGSYETLFLPATSVRRLIQQDFDQVFHQKNPLNDSKTGDAHVLLVPSATSPAPRLDKANEASGVDEYIDDVMTLPANLAGIPAITIPSKQYKGNDKYPIGLQLMGQYGSDRLVMKIADMMTKDF